MKVLLILYALFSPLAPNLLPETGKADSLKKVLARSIHDTDKVNTLILLSREIGDHNPDSAIILANQAIGLSRKISWGKGIIISQISLGLYNEFKGNVNTALSYEDSALTLSSKYQYFSRLSSIYNELGNITSEQSNNKLGLEYYFKALAIDSVKDKESIAYLCNNIGLDYEDMGNYLKAEEYYLKALKIYEKNYNKEGIASISTNLGTLYYLQHSYSKGLENNFKAMNIDSSSNDPLRLIPDFQNIGLGYMYLNEYNMSLAYTFKALDLAKKMGEFGNLPKAIGNIGQSFIGAYEADTSGKIFSYIRNNHTLYVTHSALLDSALLYEQNSITYALLIKDRISIVTGTRGLGDIYVFRKDYAHAITCYQKAYDMADSLGLLQQKMEFSQVLAHTLAKVGDYKSSVKYLDNVISLKDTLLGSERSRQIEELEAKYENEKKKKEIEVLAQKNEIQSLQIQQNHYLISGLAFLTLLIAGIAFLLARQNKIKALHVKIELQQKLLRSQMNPHFIFNAMTSIQNFIYKEEPQKAANYLSSVFKLMRSILEGSKQEYVSLEKEIATLQYYLNLQQLCFQNKFDFTIDVDPVLNTDNIDIPPMIAQPFIENAIEHGISHKTEGTGLITIRLKQQDEIFVLEIEDNGVGRDKAGEIKLKHSEAHLSVATNITKERIALLNKGAKKKITMNIIDLKDERNEGVGTRVVFSFPINNA